jgi:multicomponent Na+:H+ antiporter subunit G
MIADAIVLILMACGIFFMVVGAVGFIRLPDVFCRLHVTGVLDTLGAPLIMLAAAVHLGLQLTSLKLVLATIFLTVTSPLVGHLLARAALEAGHRPGVIEDSAEFVALGPEQPALPKAVKAKKPKKSKKPKKPGKPPSSPGTGA